MRKYFLNKISETKGECSICSGVDIEKKSWSGSSRAKYLFVIEAPYKGDKFLPSNVEEVYLSLFHSVGIDIGDVAFLTLFRCTPNKKNNPCVCLKRVRTFFKALSPKKIFLVGAPPVKALLGDSIQNTRLKKHSISDVDGKKQKTFVMYPPNMYLMIGRKEQFFEYMLRDLEYGVKN